jgi:hypothetical protein
MWTCSRGETYCYSVLARGSAMHAVVSVSSCSFRIAAQIDACYSCPYQRTELQRMIDMHAWFLTRPSELRIRVPCACPSIHVSLGSKEGFARLALHASVRLQLVRGEGVNRYTAQPQLALAGS